MDGLRPEPRVATPILCASAATRQRMENAKQLHRPALSKCLPDELPQGTDLEKAALLMQQGKQSHADAAEQADKAEGVQR